MTENPIESGGDQIRLRADVSLIAVAVIWGLNMPIMKFAPGQMDPFLFNALRLTLSAITLALCLLWQRNSNGAIRAAETQIASKQSRFRRWMQIVWFSLMAGFAYQVCFLIGINMTSAGNTALIMSAIPVWTAVLAFLVLREKLSKKAWLGLLVAVAGVLVVTFCKQTSSPGAAGSLWGNVIVSIAAFSWALASVLSRPIMRSVKPIQLAFYSMAFTVPLHFMIASESIGEVAEVFSNPLVLLALLYSGVFSTGIAYALWNFGVQQLGAAHAAGYQNLVPLVALLASWALLAETPYAIQIVGGMLIIGGLVAMRKQSRKV